MKKKNLFYGVLIVLLTFMLMPFVNAKTTAYFKKNNGVCSAYPDLPGFCIQPGVTYSSNATYKTCDTALTCYEAAAAYYGYITDDSNGFWQAQRILNGRTFYSDSSCTSEIGISNADSFAIEYCKLPSFQKADTDSSTNGETFDEFTIKMGEDFEIKDVARVLSEYSIYYTTEAFTAIKNENSIVITPLNLVTGAEILVYKGSIKSITGKCSSSSQNYIDVTGKPYVSRKIKINIVGSDETVPEPQYQIGQLRILKTDEQGNPIEGAMFKLGINLNGVLNSEYVVKTTNAEGYVTYDNIVVGSSFYYQEISAPAGYTIRDPKIKYIYIGESKEYQVHVVNTTNNAGSIKITKVDSEDNKLQGVKFRVGTNVDGTLGTDYTIETTDQYGEINKYNLEQGVYQVREEEALSGYVFSPTDAYTYTLIINEEQNYDEITVKNYKNVQRMLTIVKKDKANEKVIPDVTFNIYREDGTKYLEKTTDSNGKIIVDNIEYGEYYLEEVQEAPGYAKLNERINFEITPEMPNITLMVYNEISDTKTGLLDVTLYFALGLSLAAVVYTTLKRKQKLF